MRSHERQPRHEPDATIPLDIGGWRIVRRLPPRPGRERFLVTLDVAQRSAADDWSYSPREEHPIIARSSGRALELHRETLDASLALRDELALRSQLRVAYQQEILDSSVCANGATFAVVERIELTLAELVGRVALDDGAIVSLLAPLVETIAEVHDRGYTLEGLGLQDVGLENSGRPVVLSWERLKATRSQDMTKRDPAVAEDWRQLAGIARQLGLEPGPALPKRLAELIDLAARGDMGDEHAPAVLEALFDFAPGGEIPLPDGDSEDRREVEPAFSPRRRTRERAAGGGQPKLAQRALDLAREEFSKVRKPVWIVAAASCLAALCALWVAMQGGSEREAVAATAATPSITVVSTGTPASSSTPEASDATASSGSSAEPRATAASEDRLAELLTLRNEAVGTGEVSQLRAAFAEGSPGLERELLALEAGGKEQLPLIGWKQRDAFGEVIVFEHNDGIIVTMQGSGDEWLLRDIARSDGVNPVAPSSTPAG